jgi:23S rRNA (uracil1939-C5)-methyltransferase
VSEYEDVRIGSLAYQGAGVARLASGKTVFVEGAATGDLARVRVQSEHERFAHGVIEELLEPSPERIEPACPYHARCGGCGLQHVAYSAQLKHKRRFVLDALKRIGGVEDAEELVGEALPSPLEWGYRNRVELEPLWQGKRLTLGLHAADSSEVIPIKRCLLFPEGYEDLPTRLAGALGFALREADAPLRRVGIRVSRTTGAVELALWTEPGPCDRAFVAKVMGDALKTSSLVRVLAAGPLEKRDVRKVEVLSGHGFWQERISGLRYRVSAPSFFQVNSLAAERLVERVLTDVGPNSAHVVDLYSGVGTFTLPLAQRTEWITAIEMASSSIRDLRRNLIEHRLEDRVEALGGDAARLLPELEDVDCVVVDPPRGGLSPRARQALIAAAPPTLIYVSCDPATLARDLRELLAAGYRLAHTSPVDLFPQTWHIESVTKLVR